MALPAVRPIAEGRKPTRKRERTRALILRTAIDVVADVGVAAASAARIADRCDLSWGVIQYHFGDRDGLFLAAIEHAVAQLLDSLPSRAGQHLTLEQRLDALVEGTWALLESPAHAALLEMQLELAHEPKALAVFRRRGTWMRRQLRDAWRQAFAECPADRVDAAERLATSMLRGLSLERTVTGTRAAHKSERAFLVKTLAHQIRTGAS